MTELLEFDAAEHVYSVNGRTLPSVTQVLNTQFPLNVPQDRLEFARALGKEIHYTTELYDRDKLDISSVDLRVMPYLEAWMKFRREMSCKIVEVEKQVHHSMLNFAGTLDRVLLMLGARCIVDLKRPLLTARVGVQLAAYQAAYNASAPDPATRRFGIQLRNDGQYRLKEYSDPSDWSIFVSSLSIFNWRQRHGD